MSQTPSPIFGSGYAHVSMTRDGKGKTINTPQVVAVPSVQNISFDLGKRDTKPLYGQASYPIHVGGGKASSSVTFECGEGDVDMFNQLHFGQSVVPGGNIVYRDQDGVTVPDSYSVDAKIRNVITFWLSKPTVFTSLTIGGSAASTTSLSKIPAGSYKKSGNTYFFSDDDVAKTVALSYTCAGDAGVVSTFKIPPEAQINIENLGAISQVLKTGFSGFFTQDTYSLSGSAPASHHYQKSPSGILVFNSAESVSVTVKHSTDGVSVSSLIATLPAAGYQAIVDPPSSMVFTDDNGVILKSDAGTAMTGISVGGALATNATPSTGQYKVDTDTGLYTFASADVGDVVTISFLTDYEFVKVNPPDDGDFVRDLGVRNANGARLVRVALTSPVSLGHNQYAVSASGQYFFDSTNAGDEFYIDYEYYSTRARSLQIENVNMGNVPVCSLDLSGTTDGVDWHVNYPRAAPKSISFATKQDDHVIYKVEFEVMANRINKTVGTITMRPAAS